LIAILIFSIGILALVGMQATAINNVSDAKYRSTAGFMANQIVGTIWAKSSSVLSASNVWGAAPDLNFCTPTACGGTASGPDATAWVSGVVAALPIPAGVSAPTITINGAQVTVTISWQPPRSAIVHRHSVSAFIN
jgi:type IV pilus assembly protein PilV